MTAAEHEVQDALREGVTILDGVMPVEVLLAEDGRARGLKMARCTMEEGRPTPTEGAEFEIAADLIVSAIGQGGNLEGLEELDNGRGLIDATSFFEVADRPGHFVAGDIVRPHLLTTAIGQAAIAAEGIDHYLRDAALRKRPKVDVHHFNLLAKLSEAGLEPEAYASGEHRGTCDSRYSVHNYEDRSSQEIITHERLFLAHFPYDARRLRTESGPDREAVLGHFEERMEGLDDEAAAAEAGRCMSCGMCFECDNCVVFCPQDAVFRVKKDERTTGRYVDTDYDRCIGCHICADVCPTGYIDMALGDH